MLEFSTLLIYATYIPHLYRGLRYLRKEADLMYEYHLFHLLNLHKLPFALAYPCNCRSLFILTGFLGEDQSLYMQQEPFWTWLTHANSESTFDSNEPEYV